MPKGLSNLPALDKVEHLGLVLDIPSFSSGENTVGQDHELQTNEARICENWDAVSLGGMKRTKGLSAVGTGEGYTDQIDLAVHHFEGASSEFYAVAEGDVLIKSGADLNLDDNGAFTSGVLCHAVSAGSALWITNATDNLKRKTIGNAIAAATGVPPAARERIYEHNSRLIAEGGGATIYGSRVGTGNWNSADSWTANSDAWSMTFSDYTRGCVPGFPTGNDLAVFTEFDTFVIYNQPGVARRRVTNGIGCGAPLSISRGNEGVFFFSTYPTRGIFLWDGVNFINLTEKHTFQDDVNTDYRIFGIYRDRKYYFMYCENGATGTYPNKLRVYDTRFGRWMDRPVNLSLADNLGYPSLQTKLTNELYIGSSRKTVVYELDGTATADGAYNTEANYKTKVFTSKDFITESGGAFPIDNVRIKLVKITVEAKGTAGTFSVAWTVDRGRITGSQTFTLATDGAIINDDFVVNTSKVVLVPSTRHLWKSFNNSAVGRLFEFQILNSGTGDRPEIKKIRIHALAMEEE